MVSRNLVILLVLGITIQSAWASSDFFCEPHWTLNQGAYSHCSGLPFLAPGNDTRINLKLMLVDEGLAKLQAKPVSKEDAELGYGKVPFSLETFDNSIFLPRDGTDNASGEDENAGYGEGTRCVSSDTGKADFIDALNQSKKISAAERKLLTEERQKLNPDCVDVPASNKSAGSTISKINAKNLLSPTSRQFMRYLTAAAAFYQGRYGEAESGFAGLVASDQPWLQEASRYMLGRTDLNLAQQNAFDSFGYPTLDKVDQKRLFSAEVKLNNYLKAHPRGRYAPSARGLLRRIYWMSNQPQKLADEFQWQLDHPASPQHNLSLTALVQEADSKLFAAALPKQIRNPLFLATLDLALMRPADSSGAQQLTLSDLRKQRPLFAGHTALFEYLLAAHHFFVKKDPAGALKALPDTLPAKMRYLDFSRMTLRGLALEATRDHAGARTLWEKMLRVSRQPLQRETLQLALALNYEYARDPEPAFASHSPITETAIRDILIRTTASAKLLRQIVKSETGSKRERYTALYTLLYKDLLQGQYRDYIKDYPLLPGDAAKYTHSSDMNHGGEPHLALFTWSGKKSDDGYGCPSTLHIAGILAKNAKDPLGLICLGDFVHSNDLESGPALKRSRSSDVTLAELGSLPSHFPGELFSRGEGYKTVIADVNAAPGLKAYALYRSIQCYATAGFNHCGGKDVEKHVRKSWFQTLKKRYATSVWAKELKYYW